MRTVPWLLAVTGCVVIIDRDKDDDEPPQDTDPSAWTGGCDDATVVFASDEVTPLGFSGDDVVAAATASASAPAVWVETGERTTVILTLQADGDPVFHDRSPADLGDVGADPACPDWLEVPVRVGLSTEDGAFDETLIAALSALELGVASASGPVDWRNLGGTFDITTVLDPVGWDEVDLDWENVWSSAGIVGQVTFSASRAAGSGVGTGAVGAALRWPVDDG